MSVTERLAGFFVAPARAAPTRADPGAGTAQNSPVDAPPVARPGRDRAPAGAAGPAVASTPAEESAVDASERTVDPRSPARAFANQTDGTAARRLEPGPEPERRPLLRLVPPGAGPALEAVEVNDTGPSSPPPVSGKADLAVGTPLARAVGSPEPHTDLQGERSAPRVCVLGDGRVAAVLARALASRLSRDAATRCAVLCRVPSTASGPPAAGPGCPRPAARRLARRLGAGGLTVVPRARLVELVLRPHADMGPELVRLTASIDRVPLVTALPAARSPELDPLLSAHDLILLAVAATAPEALTELALAGLQRAAPGAVVRSVTVPTRFGPGSRRAVVDAALEALR